MAHDIRHNLLKIAHKNNGDSISPVFDLATKIYWAQGRRNDVFDFVMARIRKSKSYIFKILMFHIGREL